MINAARTGAGMALPALANRRKLGVANVKEIEWDLVARSLEGVASDLMTVKTGDFPSAITLIACASYLRQLAGAVREAAREAAQEGFALLSEPSLN